VKSNGWFNLNIKALGERQNCSYLSAMDIPVVGQGFSFSNLSQSGDNVSVRKQYSFVILYPGMIDKAIDMIEANIGWYIAWDEYALFLQDRGYCLESDIREIRRKHQHCFSVFVFIVVVDIDFQSIHGLLSELRSVQINELIASPFSPHTQACTSGNKVA